MCSAARRVVSSRLVSFLLVSFLFFSPFFVVPRAPDFGVRKLSASTDRRALSPRPRRRDAGDHPERFFGRRRRAVVGDARGAERERAARPLANERRG
jgi:hypothetical protein